MRGGADALAIGSADCRGVASQLSRASGALGMAESKESVLGTDPPLSV